MVHTTKSQQLMAPCSSSQPSETDPAWYQCTPLFPSRLSPISRPLAPLPDILAPCPIPYLALLEGRGRRNADLESGKPNRCCVIACHIPPWRVKDGLLPGGALPGSPLRLCFPRMMKEAREGMGGSPKSWQWHLLASLGDGGASAEQGRQGLGLGR